MQSELKALQELQRKNQFLELLVTVGEYLKNREKIKIEAIEYRNQALILNLELESFKYLDQLSKNLKSKGLMIKREYARTEDKVVKARLNVSRGSS